MFLKLLFGILLLALSVDGTEFYINGSEKSDTVRFESPAKLEFISGRTHSIEGYFSCDPENLDQPVNGIIKVDLRTLKTGIETRDGHMRDNHLQTDKFPFAYYEIQSIIGLPKILEQDKEYIGKVSGNFYIHGLQRNLKSDIKVKYVSGLKEAVFTLIIEFSIKLDDYKIARPSALFLKLAEKIEVRIILRASDFGQTSKIMLPQWDVIH